MTRIPFHRALTSAPVWLIAMALATLASPARAATDTPLLAAPFVGFSAPGSPSAMLTADLNGDGLVDAVLLSVPNNAVEVLLAGPLGSFAPAVSYPTFTQPTAFTFVDYDHDGHPDLAVTCFQSVISLLHGHADGSFELPVNIACPLAPMGIAAGDLNHDGWDDLAVTNLSTSSWSMYLNTGAGSFTRTDLVGQKTSAGTVIADIDLDGNADVVDGNWTIRGNGDGTFKDPVQGAGSGQVIDMNRNGLPDLVAGNRIFPGAGNGTFVSDIVHSSVAASGTPAVADYNGDGFPDLIAPYSTGFSSVLLVYRNTLSGPAVTFPGQAEVPTGLDAVAVAAFRNTPGGPPGALVLAKSTNELIVHGPGTGTPFAIQAVLPHGGNVSVAKTVDLDGDGDMDFVLGGASSVGELRVILNDGTPDLAPFQAQFAGGIASLDVGDLDGDSFPDAVFTQNGTYPSTPSSIAVCRQNVFGSPFFNQKFVPVGWQVNGASLGPVVLGKFNADAFLDLAVVQSTPPGIALLFGHGDLTFDAPVLVSNTAFTTMRKADLNGDGHDDLVCTTPSTFAVFLGNGAGGFAPELDLPLLAGVGNFELGDLNGDGTLDLASSSGGTWSTGTVSTFLGAGDGTFGSRHDVAIAGAAVNSPPRIADLDGDGFQDVVVAKSSNLVSVLFGHGDGTVTLSPRDYGGGGTLLVPPVDLDGNGRPDVVVNQTLGLAILWNGTGVLAAPAPRPEPALSLAAAPNPARTGTIVSWSSPRDEQVSLRIYDASGRLISSVANARFGAGAHEARWDLTAQDGSPVPAGLYFAALATSASRRVTRIAVMR